MMKKSATFYAASQVWFDDCVKDKSKSHSARIKRILFKELFMWHDRPFSSIQREDVVERLHAVEESGRHEVARCLHRALRRLYEYGINEGWARTNPAEGLAAVLKVKQSKQVQALSDPNELGSIIADIEDGNASLIVKAAVKLSILLFPTPGQLRSMAVQELDLKAGLWTIPASKTRLGSELLVPLSPYAISTIRRVLKYTKSTQYVFAGARGSSRCISDNTVRMALRDIGRGKELISPNGFRASAHKLLAGMGWDEELICIQQGRQFSETKSLLREDSAFALGGRRQMMEHWSDFVLERAAEHGYRY